MIPTLPAFKVYGDLANDLKKLPSLRTFRAPKAHLMKQSSNPLSYNLFSAARLVPLRPRMRCVQK